MKHVLLVAVLLAGCTADAPPPDEDPGPTAAPAPYGIPEAIHETGLLPVGLQWECTSGPCPTYGFELHGNTSVDVVLSWNVPANDIDVFVYGEDGGVVLEGIAPAPQTTEQVDGVLPAGIYTVSIEPYEAATDQYTLDVTFERA